MSTNSGDFDDPPSDDPVVAKVREVLTNTTIEEGFRRQLRERLLAEAIDQAARRQRPAGGGAARRSRRWLAAPLVAAVAAAVLLVVSLSTVGTHRTPSLLVSASSPLQGVASVDPTASLLVHFSQAMDHRSVEAALRVEPAVAVRTTWQGDDLVVSAADGLAPNTGYAIGFDQARARTATGARLTTDPQITFGTLAVPPASSVSTPATLLVKAVAPAADGSEAVITADGSVLGTAVRTSSGDPALARVSDSGPVALGPATPAICVSRSGHSLAYLTGTGPSSSIVMADGNGRGGRSVSAAVDAGSPLGWIGDNEVSFVGGGTLRAVDRTGRVRTLQPGPIHPDTDTVALAPGGRWVFLAAAGQSTGRIIDLQTGSARLLSMAPGSGGPVFGADGATVYWVGASATGLAVLAAPSGGGPTLRIPLPLGGGDQVSDLAVNPDGSLLVYTVHHADGSTQLRLAGLPSGATVAEAAGSGESPNWAPTGDAVAVLGSSGSGSQIDLVQIASALRSNLSSVGQTANAFANAQIAGDSDAAHSISNPPIDLGSLPHPSRSSLLDTTRQSNTSWQVHLRLSVDPTPAAPTGQATLETLTIDTASGRPLITSATAPPLAATAAGPHLAGVSGQSGVVVLIFDSDLDAATVPGSVVIAGPDGRAISVSLRYDATAKAVIATGSFPSIGHIDVSGRLKDINGRSLRAVSETFDLAG